MREAILRKMTSTMAFNGFGKKRRLPPVIQGNKSMNRSSAYSFIKERVELEFHNLEKDKVTPWAFFLSGKELRLTDFFGKEIYYFGIRFEGSPREVFWRGFIQPFIKDITSRSFADTWKVEGSALDTGHVRKH